MITIYYSCKQIYKEATNMTKKLELLNQLVADLAVANVKFHNLHWNVVGERFKEVHVFAEELYDMLFEQYDEVAERVKMIGEFPPAALSTYLEMTKIEELSDKDYTIKETLNYLLEDIQYLKGLAIEARNVSDEEGDFATVAMLEDIVGTYCKHDWFISQMLK